MRFVSKLWKVRFFQITHPLGSNREDIGKCDIAAVIPFLLPPKQRGAPMEILGCYSDLLYLVECAECCYIYWFIWFGASRAWTNSIYYSWLAPVKLALAYELRTWVLQDKIPTTWLDIYGSVYLGPCVIFIYAIILPDFHQLNQRL